MNTRKHIINSELAEAFAISAAIPRLHAEAHAKASEAIKSLSVSDLHLLADAVNQHYKSAGTFQSATGTLAVAIMKKLGVKLRVAIWHMVNNRCQHKQYEIGTTVKARIGEIGDQEWIEAWIA